MENIWKVLGLAPTNDQRAIRQAYARLSKDCHPEDDPEGFERLHNAYEEAMEYARKRPYTPPPEKEEEEMLPSFDDLMGGWSEPSQPKAQDWGQSMEFSEAPTLEFEQHPEPQPPPMQTTPMLEFPEISVVPEPLPPEPIQEEVVRPEVVQPEPPVSKIPATARFDFETMEQEQEQREQAVYSSMNSVAAAIQQLYRDPHTRYEPGAWRPLFQSEPFQQVKERPEFIGWAVDFLRSNHDAGKRVWRLLRENLLPGPEVIAAEPEKYRALISALEAGENGAPKTPPKADKEKKGLTGGKLALIIVVLGILRVVAAGSGLSVLLTLAFFVFVILGVVSSKKNKG